MVSNTRFNPTVNGPLHIGHAYMMLVNQAEAKRSRGHFSVRFDDNQAVWEDIQGPNKTHMYTEQQKQDIFWLLGETPFFFQSEMEEEAKDMLMRKCERSGLPYPSLVCSGYYPKVYNDPDPQYPFTSYLTAEKVIMDHMMRITILIRGLDLLNEFSLYSYFSYIFQIDPPVHVYLPRLRLTDEAAPVSKTEGGHTIASYRESGWTPGKLISKLAQGCLIDPSGKWNLDNLKSLPTCEEF